jgi:hypothetical protein
MKFLIDEYPHFFQSSLAVIFGVNKAVAIQYIHFWAEENRREKRIRMCRRGKWWVYKKYSSWHKLMPWVSRGGIKNMLLQLRKEGVLIAEQHEVDSKTGEVLLRWRINYDNLMAAIEDYRAENGDENYKDDEGASDENYEGDTGGEDEIYKTPGGNAPLGNAELADEDGGQEGDDLHISESDDIHISESDDSYLLKSDDLHVSEGDSDYILGGATSEMSASKIECRPGQHFSEGSTSKMSRARKVTKSIFQGGSTSKMSGGDILDVGARHLRCRIYKDCSKEDSKEEESKDAHVRARERVSKTKSNPEPLLARTPDGEQEPVPELGEEVPVVYSRKTPSDTDRKSSWPRRFVSRRPSGGGQRDGFLERSPVTGTSALAERQNRVQNSIQRAPWFDSVPEHLRALAQELGKGPWEAVIQNRPGRATGWLQLSPDTMTRVLGLEGHLSGFERAWRVADRLDEAEAKVRRKKIEDEDDRIYKPDTRPYVYDGRMWRYDPELQETIDLGPATDFDENSKEGHE